MQLFSLYAFQRFQVWEPLSELWKTCRKSGAFYIDKRLPLPQNGNIGGEILPEIYLGISIPEIVVSSKIILPSIAGVIVTAILVRNSLN